jgi:hypothetical protein
VLRCVLVLRSVGGAVFGEKLRCLFKDQFVVVSTVGFQSYTETASFRAEEEARIFSIPSTT